MTVLTPIAAFADQLKVIQQDLHAHPELGFEEVRTSGIVAETLRGFGVDELHTGLGGTGVVAVIHGNTPGNRRIGLRADMDALPIHETSGLPYASTTPGVMHACGHDGHTTMLLGAAKYLGHDIRTRAETPEAATTPRVPGAQRPGLHSPAPS